MGNRSPTTMPPSFGSCLRAIAAALRDEDADFREDVSSLLDCPCILSVANRLARAHEVAVKDSDWHAAPFGDDIDADARSR